MGLYEFFYPQLAQAEALRNIAASMGRAARAGAATRRKASEADESIGTLALVLLGLVGTLVEKGVIRKEDLLDQLRKVDGLDGAADGKVDPAHVLAALGFALPAAPPAQAPVPKRTRR
jgi:hypothetical protein